MARIALVIVTLGFTLLLGIATECGAQGAQACSTGSNAEGLGSTEAVFYPVKPRGQNSLRRRDLEFQWDSMYDTLGTKALSETDQQTLENLGKTLAELPAHNPFGANLSDIQLVHEYFRAGTTPAYNINPFAPSGLVVGFEEGNYFCRPTPCGASIPVQTPSSERGHSDHYLRHPARGSGAQYPSQFYAAKEDSSTGWWSVDSVTSDTTWTAWGTNSIETAGPLNASLAARTDLDGTGWTRPGGVHNIAFCHEFQHSMPKGGAFNAPLDEIFGLGAEAISGNELGPTDFDVSYVYSLISNQQQQHKWMFASYLAYNFRGTDTTATLTGFQDDLFYRWAKGDRRFSALSPLLSDAICAECSPALKPYFHPGGVPLDDHSRLQLLLHNWRVANFVNKSSLANGQYGYPPQFGFTPKDDAGAWQSRDLNGPNDVHAIPPEVVARPTLAVRETTMVGTRFSAAGSFPMSLHQFGSEYWVVRADPALGTTPRDLMIRVSPEGIYRCLDQEGGDPPPPPVVKDLRLMASVVAYSVPADSLGNGQLWAHPEWAVQVLPPIWVDVDSVAGGLELVLPGFGTTVNAAVVVISLGDGPSGGFAQLSSGGSGPILPYRLNLALRTAPHQDPNPSALLAGPLQIDQSPTWSPAGDEIAFVRHDQLSGDSGIYRKALDGSPPVLLGTAGPESRSEPDWSPRGDWIAFSRQASGGSNDAHIWLVHRWTQEVRQLTSGPGHTDASPAFEPHGQRIAYLSSFPGQQVPRQLRRVNLDGTVGILMAEIDPPADDGSLRWTPDGGFVYFARNGTLYAVPADGGAPISRPALLTGVNSFDFHRGQGPLLAGQAGIMTTPDCSTQPGKPFVRIASSDTLANDSQARFYRTGAEFYQPRWSPDGTRIVYSSNQNTGAGSADLDLFVGQVSFNHAPTMLAPTADRVVHTGRPYEFYANASDPDGEALTYKSPSAFLPAGASFTESTRRFYWPSPGPVCSEHYVVFRALDGSGGVSSKVIKYTAAIDSVNDLSSPLVGDNDIWLTWTAPGDNGALGRGVEYELRYAQVPLNEAFFDLGTLVTGMAAPGVPGANESQVISGLSPGTTYYIAIRTRDLKNNWSVLSSVLQIATTINGPVGDYRAHEVRAPLSGSRQARTATSRPGSTDGQVSVLTVEMALEGSAPTWSVRELRPDEIPALGLGDSTAVLLQARDAGGAWTDRARMRPEVAASRFAIRALERPGRIVFNGTYGVRQAWNTVELDGRIGAARLETAQHSRLGDIKAGFDARGTASLDVAAAESLTMVYEVVDEDSETAQDWYLLVGPPGSEVGTPLKAGSATALDRLPLPTVLRLRQNQPNPFSGRTTIHFDLPTETRVRLEVFDAQGRLVRTLADGSYPAGFHAAEWDHRSDDGQALGAGVYLYRIAAGVFRDQRKMVLLAR